MKRQPTLWLATVLILGSTAILRGDLLGIQIDSTGTNLLFSSPDGRQLTQKSLDEHLAQAAKSGKTPVWFTFTERVNLRELFNLMDHAAELGVHMRGVDVEVIRNGKTSTRSIFEAPGELKAGELWAAFFVSEPIVVGDKLRAFNATFALANDTDHAIDPQVASWRLIINGEEYPKSQFLFGNGPRDARWKSLPAGDHLLFGCALGDLFKVPGTYTVIWRGKDFESPPVTFRVLNQK